MVRTITVPYLAVAFAVESMDNVAEVVVVVCSVEFVVAV